MTGARLSVQPGANTSAVPHPEAAAEAGLGNAKRMSTFIEFKYGWPVVLSSALGIALGMSPLPFYTIGERLQRLGESCQVIKALFADGKANFQGKFYQLEEATLEPKPVQRPMPLLIGGGGEKVTLKITARYADEWNVWGDPAILRHKMGILDQHCADIGRDPAEIQRSAVALLFMSEDNAFLERMRNADMQQPAIIGTPSEVKEVVEEYEQAGVDELIVPDFTMGGKEQKLATMDTFITQVAQR